MRILSERSQHTLPIFSVVIHAVEQSCDSLCVKPPEVGPNTNGLPILA